MDWKILWESIVEVYHWKKMLKTIGGILLVLFAAIGIMFALYWLFQGIYFVITLVTGPWPEEVFNIIVATVVFGFIGLAAFNALIWEPISTEYRHRKRWKEIDEERRNERASADSNDQ